MRRSDFHFNLPQELIAQYPKSKRSSSRLLCLVGDTGRLEDRHFYDLPSLVRPGDLLVFNDTRVIPARLFAMKDSGGKVEILVERTLGENRLLVQLRASKSPRIGSRLVIADRVAATVVERRPPFYVIDFSAPQNAIQVLESYGQTPLPPYIRRPALALDQSQYQTVYARHKGAVAAPTAGLHFDDELLAELKSKGVDIGFVTLHVGSGTFKPVRVDEVKEHTMHKEYINVSETLCEQVEKARAAGGRIIAVGTTSVRCLETASQTGTLRPYSGDTDIFIYPGVPVRSVDILVTNFHLPESTLLMLVCAFAGMDNVLQAYRHAVAQGYRFFSYGDAMFIHKRRGVA